MTTAELNHEGRAVYWRPAAAVATADLFLGSMPIITPDSDCCTVIVTVDAAPGLLPALEAHARIGITRFAEFPGYIGGALHVSSDHTRLVQYLQWDSESAYQACIDDQSWESLPSTREFMDAIESGQARVDARIFGVVASHDHARVDEEEGPST